MKRNRKKNPTRERMGRNQTTMLTAFCVPVSFSSERMDGTEVSEKRMRSAAMTSMTMLAM